MESDVNSRSGFGLVEALASMFILALLFLGVTMMNYTNHRAAMRIATRNEAISIGQRVIDSLQLIGISNVHSDSADVVGDTTKTVGESFRFKYKWIAKVTDIETTVGPAGNTVTSVRAKKVDIWVRWTLDNHKNEIVLNTMVE